MNSGDHDDRPGAAPGVVVMSGCALLAVLWTGVFLTRGVSDWPAVSLAFATGFLLSSYIYEGTGYSGPPAMSLAEIWGQFRNWRRINKAARDAKTKRRVD